MTQSDLRVLVVDDEEDMRATLSDYISGMGLKIKTAMDVPDSQRLLRVESPPFDIVLADLKLPGGSGLDILKTALARSRDTLVSIITGYASLETAIEAIRLGAYDYITKPFSLDEIGIKVRNMAERISLSKENARLSLRLQELLEQVSRLQGERSEVLRVQEEIRKGVDEIHRKLDLLLPHRNGATPVESAQIAPPAKATLAELTEEMGKMERQKLAGGLSAVELESKKRVLMSGLVDRL